MIMECIYRREFYLAAGDANPEQSMPIGEVFDRCIEVATDHANALGVGYDDLKEHGQSWVLSRVAIEMLRYPMVNETYSVETWVDSFNRAFSERYFRIYDSGGAVIGNARSTWVAIDVEKRTLADISRFDTLRDSITAARECPVKPCSRHRVLAGDDLEMSYHTFAYSDLDSNRHVNTVRYVELLMDRWPLEFHDEHNVARIEVSFMKECRYGETAELALRKSENGPSELEFRVNGESRVHFAIVFN